MKIDYDEKYYKYQRKYNEYLEVNNKPMMKKYKKLMEDEKNKLFDKSYYEDRIMKMVKFIRKMGLYESFQIWLSEEDGD